MSTPNGRRQRGPAVIAESASDLLESARLPVSMSPGGAAGSNGDGEELAPTRDGSTPSVPVRVLGWTDSRGAVVSGWAGCGDNGVADSAERAVLLATKLHVPAIGGALVERGALLDALSAGRGRKLTLLSAPAGWGKTTLLAQWALGAGEDQRFGWLSLDRSDNDPVWFWMYVIAALQKVSPGVGTRAVELLAMGADVVQSFCRPCSMIWTRSLARWCSLLTTTSW
jgi:LuxR family transcriptional regulator, maltose regulon positive regulatory protein